MGDDPGGHEGPFWHSWSKADLTPVIPGDPMRLGVELYPVSAIVRVGDRLRLTISGADAENLVVPTQGDEATLTVMVGGEAAARLLLPVVNQTVVPTASVVGGAFDGGSGGFAFRRPGDPVLDS